MDLGPELLAARQVGGPVRDEHVARSIRVERPERPPDHVPVDDEVTVLAYVERVLERAGHATAAAAHGAAALEIAATGGPFDVLVTDLNMPEMGGEELARQLRLRQPHLPVHLMRLVLEILQRLLKLHSA